MIHLIVFNYNGKAFIEAYLHFLSYEASVLRSRYDLFKVIQCPRHRYFSSSCFKLSFKPANVKIGGWLRFAMAVGVSPFETDVFLSVDYSALYSSVNARPKLAESAQNELYFAV